MHTHCAPRRELLAQGAYCTIEQCVCGTVHVTIGALTFRVVPEIIDSIRATFEEAAERLVEGEPPTSNARIALRTGAEKLSS